MKATRSENNCSSSLNTGEQARLASLHDAAAPAEWEGPPLLGCGDQAATLVCVIETGRFHTLRLRWPCLLLLCQGAAGGQQQGGLPIWRKGTQLSKRHGGLMPSSSSLGCGDGKGSSSSTHSPSSCGSQGSTPACALRWSQPSCSKSTKCSCSGDTGSLPARYHHVCGRWAYFWRRNGLN
jgi:hypothetical protein